MVLATGHDRRKEFLASENSSGIAEKLLNHPKEQMTHVCVRRFAATSQLMAKKLGTRKHVALYVKCPEPSGSLAFVVCLVNFGNF